MKQTKTPATEKDLIRVPAENNKLLQQALTRINAHIGVHTLWNIINVNAIERLGMSDHGPVHFQIVANIALRLTRMLMKQNVEMSVVKDFSLTNDHAELIVLLASLFHDLGMSINREGHEEFSLFLTNQLLPEIIDFLPIQERVIIGSETLHAIISHRSGGEPITIEAGIVRVADALDMSHGRSRIPFEAGQVNIHSLSAYAVEHIEIAEGKDRPILITILMNNSAGIFQVDELLKSKLKGSGIEKYIEVQVKIEGENESRLLKDYTVKY